MPQLQGQETPLWLTMRNCAGVHFLYTNLYTIICSATYFFRHFKGFDRQLFFTLLFEKRKRKKKHCFFSVMHKKDILKNAYTALFHISSVMLKNTNAIKVVYMTFGL